MRVFRVATGLRLVILLFLAGVLAAAPRPLPRTALFNLGEAVLLLVFLLWPGLPRRLGRAYLPVALVIASVLPILARQVGLAPPPGMPPGPRGPAIPILIILSPELLMALLVPTVIAAWQYDVRPVLTLVLGTALLDTGVLLAQLSVPDVEIVVALVLLLRTGVLLMVGYAVVYMVGIQRERRDALVRENTQLARQAAIVEQLAVTAERNRLARELHDTLAHTLSGLAVQLEALRSLWDTDRRGARAMLDQALGSTRSGLTEARRALHDLRASPLADLGLPLALRHLAESVAARTGATLKVRTPDPGTRFPPELEQSVYRVAQEALENVARHADARHIMVALTRENAHLLLTIDDDGRGFDQALDSGDGLGLQGMRERAEMLGGTVEITSQPGGPTTLRLHLPLSR